MRALALVGLVGLVALADGCELPAHAGGFTLPTAMFAPPPSGGITAPTDIANCVDWFRADLGITLGGSDVATWANQGSAGSADDMAQNSDTSYRAHYHSSGGLNNRAYLAFDVALGHGKIYGYGNTTTTGAKTYFVVSKLTVLNGGGHSLWAIYDGGTHASETIFDLNTYPMTTWIDHGAGGDTTVGYNDTLGTSSGHIHVHTYDGSGGSSSTGSYTASLDGTTKTVVSGGAYGVTGIASCFGGRCDASLAFVGEVSEFGIYSRVLTGPEQTLLVNYLQARYGL